MTMSALDRHSVCLRVTQTHRHLTSSGDTLMDEADREVSTLTDRAFRSLCVGDEAIYSDAEFADLPPSPVAALLKPLADERKGPGGAPAVPPKKQSSNGASSAAWQEKEMSSLLCAFTPSKNGEGAKNQNGGLAGSATVESWDKSALRSIQKELAEFSPDFQWSLSDQGVHGGLPEKTADRKSSKDSSSSSSRNSSGKLSKSKHKLKKLNIRNFFLHSEFSPFQAWRDLNQFPFGQEHISHILPPNSYPQWYDSPLYRHLATHTLSPLEQTLDSAAHTHDDAGHTPDHGQKSTENLRMPQKTDVNQTQALAQETENRQRAENTECSQKCESAQRVQIRQKHASVPKHETAQRIDGLHECEGVQQIEKVSGAETADRVGSGPMSEGSRGADKPVGVRIEPLHRPADGNQPFVMLTPSVPQTPSSEGMDSSAPWRRNRSRARSAALGGQWEKNSPAVDRPPTTTNQVRKQEVRCMEEPSSVSSTPFNITNLLTPIIPGRQDTESLDPTTLPALFMPATLDLPVAQATELKLSPEPKTRESYRSIASSLLFNLKDNRKRVKAMYSPTKFKPTGDQNALADSLPFRDAESGTPAHMLADSTAASTVCSPIPESTSVLALPGNQPHSDPVAMAAAGMLPDNHGVEAECLSQQSSDAFLRKCETSVSGGDSWIESLQENQSKGSLASKSRYPSLDLCSKVGSGKADVKTASDADEAPIHSQPRVRAMSTGRGSLGSEEGGVTPKRSVKDRVKELQSQNTSTDLHDNKCKDSVREGTDRPPGGLQRLDGAVVRRERQESLKETTNPLMPHKPTVVAKSDLIKQQPKPPVLPKPQQHKLLMTMKSEDSTQSDVADPEQPVAPQKLPLVPARAKQPHRKDHRETSVTDTDNNKKIKHAFSDRQNSYIKRQRGALVDEEDDDEGDGRKEQREAALVRELTAKLKVRQDVLTAQVEETQAMLTSAERNQHRGTTPKQMASQSTPEDMTRVKENSRVKNNQLSTSQDGQKSANPDGVTSPLPNQGVHKGALSLRGNTLAKRDLFTNIESQQHQKPQIRQGRKDTVGEVIADREGRRGTNREVTAECTLDKENEQGGRHDKQTSGTILLQRIDRDQSNHYREGQTGKMEPVVPGDSTHTSNTQTGDVARSSRNSRQAYQVSEEWERKGQHVKQRSSERREEGEIQTSRETVGQIHGGHRPRTPPAVPPRKGKPSTQEGERAGKDGLQFTAETSTKKESDKKEKENLQQESMGDQRSTETQRREQSTQSATSKDSKHTENSQADNTSEISEDSKAQMNKHSKLADGHSKYHTIPDTNTDSKSLNKVTKDNNATMISFSQEHTIISDTERQPHGQNNQSRQEDISPKDNQPTAEGKSNSAINFEFNSKKSERFISINHKPHKPSQGAAGRSESQEKEETDSKTQRERMESGGRGKSMYNEKEESVAEREGLIEKESEGSVDMESEGSVQGKQKESIQRASVDKQMGGYQEKEASSQQEASRSKEGELSAQKQAGGDSKNEKSAQRSSKPNQSKSYMRDLLSFLGLASEDKATDNQHGPMVEYLSSQSEPSTPQLPLKDTTLNNSVNIYDIMHHRSPLGSPLQPIVMLRPPFKHPQAEKEQEQQSKSEERTAVASGGGKNCAVEKRGGADSGDGKNGTMEKRGGDGDGGGVKNGAEEKGGGDGDGSVKDGAVRPYGDYAILSGPGLELEAPDRPIMSPMSDVDKGGWVRHLIEHAQNLTPTSLTPVSMTPSPSAASSPTPVRPVLFKVKDNTCLTSPVTKTVRPILHKSLQDLTAKPWSPRESLSGSERGDEEPGQMTKPSTSTPISPAHSTGAAPCAPKLPANSTRPSASTPISPANSTGVAPCTPISPANSIRPSASTPISPAHSSGPSASTPISPAHSTGQSASTPISPAHFSGIAPGAPISPAQSTGPSASTPISFTHSSGVTPYTPISPAQSTGAADSNPVLDIRTKRAPGNPVLGNATKTSPTNHAFDITARPSAGIPIMVESASPLPVEVSHSTPLGGSAPVPTPSSPLLQQPRGQTLSVPEEDGGRGSVSSGLSSCQSEDTRSNEASTGDPKEPRLTGQDEDIEGSKPPSERSGSVCSGTEGSGPGRKPPPAVLPKSEKAMKRAMKLTRRIQKAEGRSRSDKNPKEGKTEPENKSSRHPERTVEPEVQEDKIRSSEKTQQAGRSQNREKSEARGRENRGDRTQAHESRGDRTQAHENRGDRTQAHESRGDRTQAHENRGNRTQAHEIRGDRTQAHENRGNRTQAHENRGNRTQAHDNRGDRTGAHESRGDRTQAHENRGKIESVDSQEKHHRRDTEVKDHRNIQKQTQDKPEHSSAQKTSPSKLKQEHPGERQSLENIENSSNSRKQPSGQHVPHDNRKGRSSDKQTRARHGQISQSTDRHVGNHRARHNYDSRLHSSGQPNQQGYLRQSPIGNQGDRRSKSLERDLLAHHGNIHHQGDDPRSRHYQNQSQVSSDNNRHEFSRGPSHHPSPNGLFARQNSGEAQNTHPEYSHSPSSRRQNSSEHTYSPLAMRRSNTEHSYVPLARQHSGPEHTFQAPIRRQNNPDQMFRAATGRRDSIEDMFRPATIRQNSSEQVFHPANVRRDSIEHTFRPVTLRQNSAEHMFSPSEQTYPMTQRKLLQDPDSGQYFVVDMPVQVKTKTFFDPETGSYVQLPVQSAEGAVPAAPPVEMLNPSLVVYHGYMPMPVPSLPQQKPTVRHQHLTEDLEDGSPQWLTQESQHNVGKDQAYIEPVYVPQDHTPEEELDSVR